MYYASNHSPGFPPALLRFDSELARDTFVSHNPGERRLADEPEDKSGFRHCIVDASTLHATAAGIRELPEEVTP